MRKSAKKQKKQEITGLICICIGLFMFFCMFLSSTGFIGKAIKPIMYGLFGMSAYVYPLLIALFGVIYIMKEKKKVNKIKITVIFSFTIIFTCLFHIVFIKMLDATSYLNFIFSSFDLGGSIQGMGAIFAIITYPVFKLIGILGSIILYSCIILVLLILYTNMSLKKVGTNVKEKCSDAKEYIHEKKTVIKSNYDRKQEEKRAKLFVDVVEENENNTVDQNDLTQENLSKKNRLINFYNTASKSINNEIEKQEENINEDKGDITNSNFDSMSKLEDENTEIEQDDNTLSFVNKNSIENVGATTTPPSVLSFESSSKNISVNDVSKYKPAFNMETKDVGFLHLLKQPDVNAKGNNTAELEKKANILEKTLESFGIDAKVVNITCGPAITRYEIQPAHGVKISKITGLINDIKMALAAKDIRIEAPISGKNAVGIEIPNNKIRTVFFREVLESDAFINHSSKLAIALGIDIDGNSIVADLERMPHLLIAGTTGSGKSVCINNLILSFLYNTTPQQVKMIMIDPKMVELASYNNLPHLLIPVVTDSNKAAGALKWALNEMEKRYIEFSQKGVRQLSTYNANVPEEDKKPSIVVIVDELADLMMVAAQEVEEIICRIAQKGRAAGIHLVLATQRPSVNVITGIIKANVPSRIAFQVYSQIDSRTILDMAGAERLLGRGDMLFHPNGAGTPTRLQGAFVSEEEVHDITEFIKSKTDAQYNEDIMDEIETTSKTIAGINNEDKEKYDELLPDAVQVFLNKKEASISLLQRKLRIGYARAGSLVDQMEDMGIVSSSNGSKPREVLINQDDFKRIFLEGIE